MHPTPSKKDKNGSENNVVIITLLIMILLLLGFHLLLPILGLTIAVSANMWGITITAISITCVATLLFFILTGMAVLMVALAVAFVVILTIALFPILFPLLVPLLLLMLAIAVITKRKKSA